MVPIELAWFIVVVIFGFIGIVRGYLKELGVTLVMVAILFGVTTFESKITPLLTKAAATVVPGEVVAFQGAFWVVLFVAAAFVSYHGQTLSYEGSVPKGALGVVLNAASGLVNGYLIAGSVWFYLDRLQYPFLGIQAENLSATARALLPMMPPKLLAPYLIWLTVFLVFMRVVR